ncbi:MAG: SDR family oxidoreductase [Sphingomonadales bacterium]
MITGAGKGIGRAMALALAQHGASVLANNRRHEDERQGSAARVAAEITALGGTARANTASVEAPDAAAAMVADALDAFGRLDIVIHNAAIAPQKRIAKMTPESLHEAFEINYFAPVALTQAALPALRAAGQGRLIYIISNGGLYGGDGLAAYASTKAALYAFMRCAAAEGRHYGITANALAPFALSQMTQAHLPQGLSSALSPDWIGPVAAWLACAETTVSGKVYVTGAGMIREARVEETASLHFSDCGPAALNEVARLADVLSHTTADTGFDSATEAFAHIMTDLKKN